MFHYPSVIVGGNGVLFDGDVIGECIFIGHVTRSAKDPVCRARHSFETLRNHIDFLNFKILMLSSKLKAKDIIIRSMEEKALEGRAPEEKAPEEKTPEEKALEKSVQHWRKMIEWAEKQPSKDCVDIHKMLNDIKETWYAKHCSLCNLVRESDGMVSCARCLLYEKFGRCGSSTNAWYRLSISKTWEEWLLHARRMLRQLESLRK